MTLKSSGFNVWRSDCAPAPGELADLWRAAGTQLVVGHPTYGNERTIGKLLADGIRGSAMSFPGRATAFVVSDGTFSTGNPDTTVIDTAVSAALQTISTLGAGLAANLSVVACPYDGYGGDFTPGKGSALKMIFEEMVASGADSLMLADGDLRNDMARWQQVYAQVTAEHQASYPGRPYFITARYARHFVDASLTRFIVGPLTTLLGAYVPGGISGDIVLSKGAVELERKATWTEARRKYGTDISTTLDNIAHGDTVIYEVYLGAKLHDITDEAKLSVMPGEVIGAALERLLYWEREHGAVSRTLDPGTALGSVVAWGPERTGIDFIDPGETSVFDIDVKIDSLVNKFAEYQEALQAVLTPESFAQVVIAHKGLADSPRPDGAPVVAMGIDRACWVDALHQGVARALATGDVEAPKRCLNYLYTAAFLDFVKDRLFDLGLATFGEVRSASKALGVPREQAPEFYRQKVDSVARLLAESFFAGRGNISRYLQAHR